MKRAFIIAAVAVLCVVIAAGIYLLLRKKGDQTANLNHNSLPGSNNPPPSSGGKLPEPPSSLTPPVPTSGQFGLVASAESLDYFIDGQNNAILLQPDGQIIKVSGGEQTVINSTLISNVVRGSFSYDGEKLLVVFGSRQKPQASVYDFLDKIWIPLPQEVREPVWASADYRIAYFARINNVTKLMTLDLNDKKAVPKTVTALRVFDPVLNWIAQDKILIGERSSAFYKGSLWVINPSTGAIASVIQNQNGLSVLWDKKSDTGLAFMGSSAQKGGTLSVFDSRGVSLEKLTFLTLPEKCAFNSTISFTTPPVSTSTAATSTKKAKSVSTPAVVQTVNKILLCGVPTDASKLPPLPLPDAYEQKSIYTTDALYSVDLNTGGITTVFNDNHYVFDAVNLKAFRGKLYFVNRFDKKLYGVALR